MIEKILMFFNLFDSPSEPEVVISLDAEKAFDRVSLFSSLQQFGFGAGFISWIRFLCSPCASVCTNTQRSGSFPLFRGPRQGSPLSPLLFAAAIEPLSIALKAEEGIKGIQRWGTDHKLSLYADDLLLYIRDPQSSIPRALPVLKSFSEFSGYKLNISKSECYAINQSAVELPPSSVPFRLSNSGFKYLGIAITRSVRTLREQNFTALTTTVKSDLQRWNRLPLSLAGRVQTVKMNILYMPIFSNVCLSSYPGHFFVP